MKQNETVNKHSAHMEGNQGKNHAESGVVEVGRNEAGNEESWENRASNQSVEIGAVTQSKVGGTCARQLSEISSANYEWEKPIVNTDSSEELKKEKETLFEIFRGMESNRTVGDASSQQLPTFDRRKSAMENENQNYDSPVVDEATARATVIFQSAIRDMQFNSSESMCTQQERAVGIASTSKHALGSLSVTKSVITSSTEMEAPPRRVPRKVERLQRRNSRSTENLAVVQDFPQRKVSDASPATSEHSLYLSTPVPESDFRRQIEEKFNNLAVPTRKWGSSGNLTSSQTRIFPDSMSSNDICEATSSDKDVLFSSKIHCSRSVNDVRIENQEVSETNKITRSVEDLSEDTNPSNPCHEESPKQGPSRSCKNVLLEKCAGLKEKRTIGSLRSSLERKVGFMEKVLEDRIEKIWEQNVEKHPWLQPIESWIADQCKLEPTFEVKFTAPDKERAEPKIESRIIEHLKKRRRAASPKPESPGLDTSHLSSKLGKTDQSTSRLIDGEETANRLIDKEGVLHMKDVKHTNHDLFDKIKDNVKEKIEDIHRYFQRTNRLADVNRRLKSQIWSSVVTIVLVEAKNLLPMDIDGLSDPYVKFRLGTEKYKSKVVNKTLNPVWLEQFDLHLYEDPYLGQELEVTVWDRDRSHQDDLMGRAVIDLATLERETTHRLWRDLEDGSGNIFLLLTISGTTASETISDLAAHEDGPQDRVKLYERYALMNSLQRIRDVGHLTVKVYKAQGLAAADLGGKSDPFCVLELVNSRLQTQTEYKTLAPNWQKIFTFNVKDINSVLEVTVYDEDRDHKVEFLGKVAIPLLRIRNGEKRWYALKDKKLRGRAKGNSPQILLEMNVVWNVVRACIRTLNPKEKKYMEPEIKFKRQVFLRNVFRLKAIIIIFIDIGKYIQSCWEWESKMRSIFAFVLFVFGCYYFEPYMIPVMALLILLKYYLLSREGSGFNQWICGQVALITGAPLTHHATSQLHDPTDGVYDDVPVTPGDDDDDEDDKDKEEKKSLKERLQAIQEVTHTVQNSIGYIASLCEKVKNLFNFTVPYLSYLAMLLAILGVAVLYIIPIRYLILLWGINKFSRKIVRPHSVPNNEVLDLISRVPDDEEILNYRELKPLPTTDSEKSGTGGSPGTSNLTRREQRKRHKAA